MVRFAIKFGQNAKIREKVGCSADMGCNGGRHLLTAGAKLKILIFGAGGSSIRPLGTIKRHKGVPMPIPYFLAAEFQSPALLCGTYSYEKKVFGHRRFLLSKTHFKRDY